MKLEEIKIAALNVASNLKHDSVETLIEQSNKIVDYINSKVEFTKENIEQLILARDSLEYFSSLVDIPCPVNGVRKIIPNVHQQLMFKLIASENKMLFDMPRQKGITTGLLIYVLHQAIFKEHRTIVLVANRYAQAKEFTRRLHDMLHSIDNRWFKIIKKNATEIAFENGSRITVLIPSNLRYCKGLVITDLIIDQAGFISNSDTNLVSALWPAVAGSKYSKMIFAATGTIDHSGSRLLDELHHNSAITVLKMLQ